MVIKPEEHNAFLKKMSRIFPNSITKCDKKKGTNKMTSDFLCKFKMRSTHFEVNMYQNETKMIILI